jgi:hypothetical protein
VAQSEERVSKSVSKAKDSSAFDFSKQDDDMTPEERAADAKARAAAMSQQMIQDNTLGYGLESEIDKLLHK